MLGTVVVYPPLPSLVTGANKTPSGCNHAAYNGTVSLPTATNTLPGVVKLIVLPGLTVPVVVIATLGNAFNGNVGLVDGQLTKKGEARLYT